jgi:hypothetical protein
MHWKKLESLGGRFHATHPSETPGTALGQELELMPYAVLLTLNLTMVLSKGHFQLHSLDEKTEALTSEELDFIVIKKLSFLKHLGEARHQ